MRNSDMPAMPAGSVRKKRPAHDPGGNWVETDRVQPANPGLTKREHFAALAMQGLLSSDLKAEASPAHTAQAAAAFADALLAELEKTS